MNSSNCMAIIIQGLLFFLATQPNILTATYHLKTRNFALNISRPAISNSSLGSIQNTSTNEEGAELSKIWAKAGLTLIFKKSFNVSSLSDAFDNLITFYVVKDSTAAKTLQNISSQQGFSDVSTIQNRLTLIESINEGLMTVAREEKSALVLNSEETKVTKHHITLDFCNLVSLPHFQPLVNCTGAVPPRSHILESLNLVLERKTEVWTSRKERRVGFMKRIATLRFLLRELQSYWLS